MSSTLLYRSPTTYQETGDEEHQKNYKQDPCNLSRGAGYSRQAEDSRNESNDGKVIDQLNIDCTSFVLDIPCYSHFSGATDMPESIPLIYWFNSRGKCCGNSENQDKNCTF
jgi:hypothetical protein